MAVVPSKFRRLLKKASFNNNHRQQHQRRHRDREQEEAFHPEVPPGYFPIYVGEERKRYLVPAAAANSAAFKILFDLYLADDYDDVTSPGPLAVPCSVDAFETVLHSASQQMQCQFCG